MPSFSLTEFSGVYLWHYTVLHIVRLVFQVFIYFITNNTKCTNLHGWKQHTC